MLTASKFYTLLGISILVSITIALLTSSQLGIQQYDILSYITIGLFSGISMIIYLISERASKQKNKQFFLQIVMINTMIKMFSSVVLVIGFYYLIKPTTNKFIIPFLVIYLIFSIFETYFMMKQSRNTSLT